MTLIACVVVLFIPTPFIFYFHSKRAIAKSKFAPSPDVEQEKSREEAEDA